MGKFLRLRISLANRPGALAQVASLIAGQGGNITSVDVHHSAEAAIGHLVVAFHEPPDLPRLRQDLAGSGVATLVAHQETQPVDPIVASFRQLARILDQEPGDPAAALVEGVAELCASPVVWVSTASEAVHYDAGRVALQTDGALVTRTAELPAHLAGRLPTEVCLLAVPDPEPPPQGRVVFVARPAGQDFTATEIARIEALMGLHARLGRLRSRGNGEPRR